MKRAEAIEIIEECLSMTPTELTAISMNQGEHPAFKVWVSKAILSDINKGTNASMESLLNRSFGKPVETVIQVPQEKVEGFDMKVIHNASGN